MRSFLVGISGYAGTGKDTVALRLVEKFGAVHLGMTDHAKRHMADVYDWSEEQLFGPSEARNAGDLRYPKPTYSHNECHRFEEPTAGLKVFSGKKTGERVLLDPNKVYHVCEGRELKDTDGLPYQSLRLGAARYFIEEGDPKFWLSPREALQRYCVLLEELYHGSLIDYAANVHLKLAPHDGGALKYKYDRMTGLEELAKTSWRRPEQFFMTCFSDFRRKHQIQGARNRGCYSLIPVMIRVKRPGIEEPPYDHISETEQATIPDSAFDFVINNDGNFDDLNVKVDNAVASFTPNGWEHLRTDL
jgi:hypothetical protein